MERLSSCGGQEHPRRGTVNGERQGSPITCWATFGGADRSRQSVFARRRGPHATRLLRMAPEKRGQISSAKRVIICCRTANGVPGVADDTMK